MKDVPGEHLYFHLKRHSCFTIAIYLFYLYNQFMKKRTSCWKTHYASEQESRLGYQDSNIENNKKKV
jgi:hypothetical protein